jgi:hypothetical protein
MLAFSRRVGPQAFALHLTFDAAINDSLAIEIRRGLPNSDLSLVCHRVLCHVSGISDLLCNLLTFNNRKRVLNEAAGQSPDKNLYRCVCSTL